LVSGIFCAELERFHRVKIAVIVFLPMLKKIFISIVTLTAAVLLTAVLFFVMLFLTALLFPFDRKRKFLHAQCFWWSDLIIRFNPFCNFHAYGLEHINPEKTYVIVANHQSFADIAVLYQTHMQFKWVAKKSLFTVPFLGWCLTLAKHIKLERGKFGSMKHVNREATAWLRKDMSVLFFPEGTRSETGDMLPFKSGVFKLALQEKVAILPIAINGTAAAMPKGKWILDAKANVTMSVLPALETADFQPADFLRLKEMTRAMIEAALHNPAKVQ
jgi:1-acyl-sn-glycerol-3-phosphate acyltransferase